MSVTISLIVDWFSPPGARIGVCIILGVFVYMPVNDHMCARAYVCVHSSVTVHTHVCQYDTYTLPGSKCNVGD